MTDDQVISDRDREDIRLGRFTRQLPPSMNDNEGKPEFGKGSGIEHCGDGTWVAYRQGQADTVWDPHLGITEVVPRLRQDLEFLDDLSDQDRADLELGRLLRKLPRSQPLGSDTVSSSGLLYHGDGMWEVFLPGIRNPIPKGPTPEAVLERAFRLMPAS
jgi:hypothetical protein